MEEEPAGSHPLLVEVGALGSPPTVVEAEPAGIHPLLEEVEMEPAGIHPLLEEVEMEPAGIHPLLEEVEMEPAGIHPLLEEVEMEPAGIHPLLEEVRAASCPPMAVENEQKVVHPQRWRQNQQIFTLCWWKWEQPAVLPDEAPAALLLLVEVAEAEAAPAALLLLVEVATAGILPTLLEIWVLDLWASPSWAVAARAPPFWVLDARVPPFWALYARAPPTRALVRPLHNSGRDSWQTDVFGRRGGTPAMSGTRHPLAPRAGQTPTVGLAPELDHLSTSGLSDAVVSTLQNARASSRGALHVFRQDPAKQQAVGVSVHQQRATKEPKDRKVLWQLQRL
ncbi:UNVERIFIED_CONTAM: hypothetical protein FKN15_071094 [Acipenser sinensis]